MAGYGTITNATDTSATWTIWATNSANTTSNGLTWLVWNGEITSGGSTGTITVDNIPHVHQVVQATVYQSPPPFPSRDERAERRAEALLKAFLTPEQRKQLAEMSAFLVKSETGKTYKISKKKSRNVTLLGQGGQPILGYCAVADVPLADQMLTQKLMLETNEAEFCRLANSFNVRG